MPRKAGVFKRYKDDILRLYNGGSNYRAIAAWLKREKGESTTHQNLHKSHRTYLRELETERVRAPANTGKDDDLVGFLRANHAKVWADWLRHRKNSEAQEKDKARSSDVAGLRQSLDALLDAHFAETDCRETYRSLTKGWCGELFAIGPKLALQYAKACYGEELRTWQLEYSRLIKKLDTNEKKR